MNLEQVYAALQSNGFSARIFSTGAAAAQAVLQSIPAGASVGIGGSMTVKSLGLHETLADAGHPVYWHWFAAEEDRAATLAAAAAADVYLASSNAVSATGELVNIDGTGNRVAAQFWGPRRVILLCGRNKICPDVPAALQRVKAEACPANARRLGLSTPCALTGKCTDCHSPERFCRVTSILSRPTPGRDISVWLIDDDLGY